MSSTIDALNSQASAFDTSQASQSNQTMGQDDFLKLLVTQLANQDPLSPMDSEAFVAQLAQFSSLEQLINANDRLDNLAIGQMSQNSSAAVGFIGKDVKAMADWLDYEGAEETGVDYELLGEAEDVTLTITDDSGKVIRTEAVGAKDVGQHEWTWDGKDDDGNVVDEGSYRISVTATTADGNSVNAFGLAQGRVSGVSYENGYPELLIGEHRIALADVIEVLED